MQTKLTLSLEQQIIEQAKEYAKRNGMSLSKLVQELLLERTSPNTEQPELSEKLRSLYGALELPEGMDEDQARLQYLIKKHE